MAVYGGEEAASLPARWVVIGDIHDDAVIALSCPRLALFKIGILKERLALVAAHCDRSWLI